MNAEQSPQIPKPESDLSPNQIEQVFSLLTLQTEEDRLKFKVMAEVLRPEDGPSHTWSSATTTSHEETQGGANA
ncbi:MAG TPA: hypothetical protein P5525_10315 [Candidatus Paceibacterota bacterium]|nr:hypothetical protein [Candidatus Paceibacterota bacterium]